MELQYRQAHAQVIWGSINNPQTQPLPKIWDKSTQPQNPDISDPNWEVFPENKKRDQLPEKVIWELIEDKDEILMPPQEESSDLKITHPANLEEAEELLDAIPLQSTDFKPLLNLSQAVPTASVLSHEEWRLISDTISPFKHASSTGNQNYVIRLDYGFSNRVQLSGFYSETDQPLNARITGLDVKPANFWGVFGAGARWKFLANKSWSLALNGSVEKWTVGSGGRDSRTQNSDEKDSPNIFNDSGKRVETENIIGSVALPLTWHGIEKWKFTFTPAISFLPSRQGKGQGGEGEFYGTNFYISGGILWHPIPEIGLTGSIAQPLGAGTNSFDRNRKYSRVPIFSGGLTWHLNPRIALQGQITNGFGATPATALLTLPSDNRLGYNAKIVLTPDAADTPQPEFNPRQWSLSLGGLTVNTALVPPEATSLAKISSNNNGNFDATIGHSISNIFQLEFYNSKNNNVSERTTKTSSYIHNQGVDWHGSGKLVLTSPLRGAPVWSALRISFGRSDGTINKSNKGYLFAETPITLELSPKVAINFNPKFGWTAVKDKWGLGISSNIKIAPTWELIPEVNIVINDRKSSNGTLGLRWNATDDIAIEAYCSTTPSLVDIGQLLDAKEMLWGGRFTIKL